MYLIIRHNTDAAGTSRIKEPNPLKWRDLHGRDESTFAEKTRPKVSFNHAMIYVRDVARALEFYQGVLGF
jgi:hypothetical protein